jgi:hypothetical protein
LKGEITEVSQEQPGSRIPARDDKRARRLYKRRSRVRFSRVQSFGGALIFLGILVTATAVGEAYGGRPAFIVVVLALGAALFVPVPIIQGDWRDDD